MKAKAIRPVVLKKLHRLLDICVEVSNQPIKMILSDCRKREYVRVRKVFCRLATDMVSDGVNHTSLPELGLFLDVDHTTVLSNIRDWDFQIKCDELTRDIYLKAKQRFENENIVIPNVCAPMQFRAAV